MNPSTKIARLPRLDRRAFLKILALSGTGLLVPPLVTACAPSSYPALAEGTWDGVPLQEGNLPDLVREIIRCASLAPSGHNTQPWKFQIQDNLIRLAPDLSRALPVVDPDDRELYISLGTALENLLIASTHLGLQGQTVCFPADDPDAIRVVLAPATNRHTALFDAISKRQSTRSLYDGKPVPAADLEQLRNLPLEPGVQLAIFTPGDEFETLIQRVREGDQAQYRDQAFVEELITWLRFNDAEAVKTKDGLFSKCTGNPSVPRWAGEMFLRLSGPDSMAGNDEKKLRSSAGLALILTDTDDRQAWVHAGRVYERFALTATDLNLKQALMNQPIEVPALRTQLAADLHRNGAYPQLLARFGYAAEMPRSLRRPIEV